MNGWEDTILGDCAQLSSEKVDASNVRIDNYVSTDNLLPNLGGVEAAKNLPNLNKYASFRKGDVLFSNIRTYFKKVWRAEFDGGCSNDVLVFKSMDEKILNQDFLYYVLSSNSFIDYTAQTAKGTKMPRGDKDAIKRFQLKLPGITEQQEIAKTLSNLDKKITLLRQQNQTLEELAQTLFKRWFVEFEFPFDFAQGKPSEKGEPYKSSGGKMVQSELGEIPEGWRPSVLSDILELTGGGTPKTTEEEFWNGTICWYSVIDAPNNSDCFVIDTEKKITELGLAKSSTKLLREKTTIISARGTVGKLAITGLPMAMNQSCYGINGKDGFGDFYTYFQLKYALKILKRRVHGAVFDTITKSTFDGIETIIASPTVLNSFEIAITPIMEKVLTNVKEIQTLTQLRDTLLPKLMSGELRVNASSDN